MNKADLKQIRQLLDKKLEEKLDKKLKPIKAKQNAHDKSFQRINQKLGAHSESLVIIEENVRILPDLASLIKHHSEQLDNHEERIQKLEKPQTSIG